MAEPKLPSEYKFGLVTARAIRAVGDMGPEDDPYPDGPPVKLDKAVTFTPADRWRLVPGDPSQRVIQEAIVADLDDDGCLSLNGQRGLWLYHGLWHVRFAGELGWDGMDIQVTAEHTQDHPLDLWTAAGYVPAPSVTVTTLLVPATVADGDVLIRDGDHVTGVPQTRFTGPTGPTGPEGPRGPRGETGPAGPTGQPGKDAPVPASIPVTASTVDTGRPATATFSGQWPNLSLALGLPRGETGATGQPSTYMGTGRGRPDIISTLDDSDRAWVASAPIGAVWSSTDGAGVGAWQWQRTPQGWRVKYGMTPFISFQDNLLTLLRNAGFAVDPIPGMRNGVVRHNNLIMIDIGINIKSKPDGGENLDIKNVIGCGWIWRNLNLNNAYGLLFDFSTARMHWANSTYVRILDAGYIKMSRIFLEMDETMTWPISLTNPNTTA